MKRGEPLAPSHDQPQPICVFSKIQVAVTLRGPGDCVLRITVIGQIWVRTDSPNTLPVSELRAPCFRDSFACPGSRQLAGGRFRLREPEGLGLKVSELFASLCPGLTGGGDENATLLTSLASCSHHPAKAGH